MIILTCVHGRPEITEIFLDNIPSKYPIVIVGDMEDECGQIIAQYGNTTYLQADNKPLGRKFNKGLAYLKDKDFDYVFIAGSDDIFQPELFDYYETLKGKYDYVGLLDFYFHDFQMTKYCPGFVHDRKGEPHGAGRMISRKVLEQLDFKLWDDDLNSGLDASMTKRLKPLSLKTYFFSMKKKGFWAVDLKSKNNLHQMSAYNGEIVTDFNFELV